MAVATIGWKGGPWLTLVGMIDDANNEIPGRFRKKKMPPAISWYWSRFA
jgi:hypothetical protein